MRSAALIRTLKVLRVLEGGGRYQLQQLADAFNVHPRTIRRDLYALEESGVPIGHTPETDAGPNGYWWLVKS